MAKIIPSILSKKPPWPGSKSLVSLTFALRFKNEMNKSPNCAVKDIIIVIKKDLLMFDQFDLCKKEESTIMKK